MLSKSQQKLINSLQNKKYRKKNGLFVVEGVKGVSEFLNSKYILHELFSTEDLFSLPFVDITETDLNKISFLQSPNKVLGLFQIPEPKNILDLGLIVALDNVRDPGNLGTIIRLCDWFGVKQLICNEGTVDCYNPKVVQATMGSLTRVNINYLNLSNYLEKTK
ncbi:TrmH family RNA methyltransferase, partial [Aegicerativicinus sediminis]